MKWNLSITETVVFAIIIVILGVICKDWGSNYFKPRSKIIWEYRCSDTISFSYESFEPFSDETIQKYCETLEARETR